VTLRAVVQDYVRVRRPLWRFVPERRLALLVALVAPLWLLPSPFGTLAGLAALASVFLAAAVDIVLLPARRGVSVERDAPDVLGLGDGAEGTYVLRNHTARPLLVQLHDAFPSAIAGGVDTVAATVAAHGQQHLSFSVTGLRRGVASLGPIGMRVRTRLGLVGARFLIEPGDVIRVLPSVSGVRRFRLLAMQHRLDVLGVRALRRKGEGQGFASLREYVPGDEPRHIDWKATARRRKLITREFTIERSQTVFTLVDAGRAMTQQAGTFSRFEQALSSALVLTDVAVSAGDRVGTLVFDDEVRAFVAAQQSRGALRTVRNAFVPVEASSREPDYANAFRFLAAHQRKRALIVFFTDVIDVRASQALLAHVSLSAARHLTLVVALRSDELFAAAVPGVVRRGNTLQVYGHAAAEEVIQAREAALERMRRAGVVVVDVSPELMTATVVNRYLELKARGAL
jgi:uncharacterized protein (DUF58 family)